MFVGGSVGTFLGLRRGFQDKWMQDRWGHAKSWSLIAGMVAVEWYVKSVWIRGLVGLGMGYVLGRVLTHL